MKLNSLIQTSLFDPVFTDIPYWDFIRIKNLNCVALNFKF